MDILIKKYRLLLVVMIVTLASCPVFLYPKLSFNYGFIDYISSEAGNRVCLKELTTIFGGSERMMLIPSC